MRLKRTADGKVLDNCVITPFRDEYGNISTLVTYFEDGKWYQRYLIDNYSKNPTVRFVPDESESIATAEQKQTNVERSRKSFEVGDLVIPDTVGPVERIFKITRCKQSAFGTLYDVDCVWSVEKNSIGRKMFDIFLPQFSYVIGKSV